LVNYPPARALQLKLREYALTHENELLKVLKDSSDARQRRIAAEALGYARESPVQIAALVRATRDPDAEVRNNATRALGVLASSSPQVAAQIPADNFIAMMKSAVWTARNKASFVLMELTKSRNAALLAELRAQALALLFEMAKWQDIAHAAGARIILGRIAGIPEQQLLKEAFQTSPQPACTPASSILL
jgi:HEAT repeat protein